MTRLQHLHTWAEHAFRLRYMPPRLPKPAALPDVASQSDWVTGWLQGLAVGLVNGVGLAVLLGWLR